MIERIDCTNGTKIDTPTSLLSTKDISHVLLDQKDSSPYFLEYAFQLHEQILLPMPKGFACFAEILLAPTISMNLQLAFGRSSISPNIYPY